MPRGRSKAPKAYANRTDLAGKVANAVGGEMPYGEKVKLQEGQKAVPVAPQDVPAPNPEAMMQNSTPSAVPTQAPAVVPLGAPTQFPDQPISTGVAAGIDTPDPDILKLKEYLPLFEAQANLPDAPQTFKQFVSWMRTQ
jgi:hypothetical protein